MAVPISRAFTPAKVSLVRAGFFGTSGEAAGVGDAEALAAFAAGAFFAGDADGEGA